MIFKLKTHSVDTGSVLYSVAMAMQGPLSVFCARARWGPVHVICLQWGDEGLGLTLRGDSPVLVAGVVPGGCAAVRHHSSDVQP